MADVRIQEVVTDVNVTDASALLTPQMLDRIVRAVLRRLEEQQRQARETTQERSLGAQRDQ
jgi:hypothetical protein